MAEPAQRHAAPADETAQRLRHVLARLAMGRDDLGMWLTPTVHGEVELLARVIRETDETVLPRRMDLVSAQGLRATMTVSNRRLIAFRLTGQVAGEPAGDPSPDAIATDHVKSVLAIAADPAGIAFRQPERAPQASADATSCTARALLGAARSVAREGGMLRFLRATAPRLQSWICRIGEARKSFHGPEGARMEKLEIIEAHLARGQPGQNRRERLERPRPSCAFYPVSEGGRIVAARDEKSVLVAAVSEADAQAVLNEWRRIFGRA